MRILSDPKKSPPNKSYDMEVEARAGPGGHEARSPPEDRLNRLAGVFLINAHSEHLHPDHVLFQLPPKRARSRETVCTKFPCARQLVGASAAGTRPGRRGHMPNGR